MTFEFLTRDDVLSLLLGIKACQQAMLDPQITAKQSADVFLTMQDKIRTFQALSVEYSEQLKNRPGVLPGVGSAVNGIR